MKTTYDPELRKTEHGSRLYNAWKKLRTFPYDPVFTEFPDFYKWAMVEGYQVGDKLMRHDEEAPYSPENCYWTLPKEEEMSPSWKIDWCIRWNETVNRLRRYFGLPEF